MRAGVGAERGGRSDGPGPAPSGRCVSGCCRRVAGAGGRPRGRGAARLPPPAPPCPPVRLTRTPHVRPGPGPAPGGSAVWTLGLAGRPGRGVWLERPEAGPACGVVERRHPGRCSARPLLPRRPSCWVLVVGWVSLGSTEQPVISRPGGQDVATEAERALACPAPG